MRPPAFLAAIAALATTAALATPAAALATPAATPGAPRPTPGREQVTLILTPHDQTALRALAHAHGLSRSVRASRLAAALPTGPQRAAVVRIARGLGLTVRATGTFTVSLNGPSARVQELFGSARAVAPHSRFAHGLPRMPGAFRGLVTAAVGGDDPRFAVRPQAFTGYSGAQLRSAYDVTAPTSSALADQTIATVQFHTWAASDLTTYATDQGLTVAPGQYTALTPDTSNPTPIDNTADGGADEVALDQESLLGIAPTARQRAYFAPNDLEGQFLAFQAVGNDASSPNVDYHITALSTSWGACEDTDPNDAAIVDSFENLFAYVLSSGVTMFAATGDNGVQDCTDSTGTPVGGATVDYPGSSPSVVAVGGTSLPNPTSPGTQTGWGDGTNASGGGASALFFRPSWQAGVSTVTTNTRLVPDISSDADPATGLRVYSSASGGFLVAGGTSLAAPSSAAMLTDELIHAGFDWGIGDIHPGLYAAPATDFTDITSGTNSVNGVPGYTAGPGYDEVTGLGTPNWHALVANLGGSPHLRVGSASAGYSSIQRGLRVVDSAGNTVAIRVPVEIDTAAFQSFASYRVVADYQPECSNIGMTTTKPTTVDVPTSDGTPSGADGPHTLVVVALDSGPTPQCHYAYAPLVIDTVAPVAHARFTVSAANRAIASWSMADPAPSSGLLHFFVEVLDLTTNRPVYGPGFTTTGAHLFAAASGNVYKILVTAYDRAGNSGGDVAYLFDDRNLAYSAGWARSFSGAYYGGSAALSRTTGAFARVGASGRSYAAYLTFCSACGKLAVYVNGALAKVVDTYSASARYRVPVALYASSVYGGRTLTFKVLGQKNAASHGYAVLLDAVTAAT